MKIKLVDEKEICSFCFENVIHEDVYYTPPCGHLFCYRCMCDARLSICTSCTIPFTVATALKIYCVTEITETETDEETE